MTELDAPKPAKRKLARGQIDLAKRYDVHTLAHDRELVYEDVAFLALRTIEKPEGLSYSEFVELGGADGGRFLIQRHQIILICEHGSRPRRRVVGPGVSPPG